MQLAKLKRAKLQKASLEEAEFQGVKLEGAYLQQANLQKVKHLMALQLAKCRTCKNAKGLPKPLLQELRKIKPSLVEWWNGGEWDEDKQAYVVKE